MEKIITFINRYVLALVLCLMVLGFIFAVIISVITFHNTSGGQWHTVTPVRIK
ncbi:MAG: hypothetical protein ABI285_11200 [Ginsengibacter sp.]